MRRGPQRRASFFKFEIMNDLTIVAPMTPAGVSAVAALRVSGKETRNVVKALFGKAPTARLASYGTARHPQTGKAIDSLLYIYFEGPASYTGEDTLEIYPHGNPLIVRELLQAITTLTNVRLAEPGEFTKRAFLNGKLDLVQAASVGDVIHSTSQSALENARKLLGGKFSKQVKELAATVLDFSARVELDVDFTEEEADPDVAGWQEKLDKMLGEVNRLLANFRSAESMNKLPLAVVYGAPNAGKSSLINALLEDERLLVSNVAGTTRDFVEVRLMLPRGEIRLIDTAGLSDVPVSELDKLSMEKSRKVLAEADLKIHLVDIDERQKTKDGRRKTEDGSHCEADASTYHCEADACTCHREADASTCHCEADASTCHCETNASTCHCETEAFPCHCEAEGRGNPDSQNDSEILVYSKADTCENVEKIPQNALCISSKTGKGLAELRELLNEKLYPEIATATEDFWVTSEREKACLEEAAEGIGRAQELLATNPAVELIAFEMQTVRRALQSITGEISSEDVLQSIFAGFCIGK